MTQSFAEYRRADGVLFMVAPSGQVYEVRDVSLTAYDLEKAALNGHLKRLDEVTVPDESSVVSGRPEPDLERALADQAQAGQATYRARQPRGLTVLRGGMA